MSDIWTSGREPTEPPCRPNTTFPLVDTLCSMYLSQLDTILDIYSYLLDTYSYFLDTYSYLPADVHTWFTSSQFFPNALFLFQVYVYSLCSLGASWLWQFLRLYSCLMILLVLSSIPVRYFVEHPSLGIHLMFCSWCNWSNTLWGRKATEVRGHQCAFTSQVLTLTVTYHLSLTEVMFVRFLHYQVTLFPFSPWAVIFGRNSLCLGCTQRLGT